jgi:hypothetical protein
MPLARKLEIRSGRGPRPARCRRRGRRSRCERPRGSQDRCLRRIRASVPGADRLDQHLVDVCIADRQKRIFAALSLRCALEEQSPIVLSRSGILHVPGDVPKFAASFCRWARGPTDDFELINDCSQSLLPLRPRVYDIVSWRRSSSLVAEVFERLSTVRLPRRMCPPSVRRSLSPWRGNSTS